ncbi:hypothetical protein [Methylibium sp.]|uniref:hypothetical protein n=1 Tax=Methylibium sp. TaxID=2067992 RepID=UPI003340AC52
MDADLGQLLIVLVAGVVTYIDTQILIPRRDRLRLELQRRQMYARILEKLKAGRGLT